LNMCIKGTNKIKRIVTKTNFWATETSPIRLSEVKPEIEAAPNEMPLKARPTAIKLNCSNA
jgi:hypothetical protein